jgi:hypothetical protein
MFSLASESLTDSAKWGLEYSLPTQPLNTTTPHPQRPTPCLSDFSLTFILSSVSTPWTLKNHMIQDQLNPKRPNQVSSLDTGLPQHAVFSELCWPLALLPTGLPRRIVAFQSFWIYVKWLQSFLCQMQSWDTTSQLFPIKVAMLELPGTWERDMIRPLQVVSKREFERSPCGQHQ